MVKIALSQVMKERRGDQIKRAAPDEIEFVVVDQRGAERWRDADILINSEFANRRTLEDFITHMPRLHWIHTIYAGTDDIPWELVTERKLIVTNSAGVYAPMMAEYVIAMLVMLYRNLHIHVLAQQQHRQMAGRPLDESSDELYNKRMGILGYGAVGRRLAETANALGMHVWALRRTPTIAALEPVERMLDSSEMHLLLSECDIVVITASLNTSTRGLLGAQEFAQMKRGAVLVNVARGRILDEGALVQSLEQRHLRGAILDVTSVEPLPQDSPLWDTPNLLLTPHISGEMPVGRERSIELFCKNLRLDLDGHSESMGNRVDSRRHS